MTTRDDERVASDMACIACKRKTRLSVLVDINVGLNRCGVEPGEPARQLAKSAVEKGLRIRGVMGYEGHLQALPPGEERNELVRAVGKSLVDSKHLIESDGIAVPIVSTGGTGTYEMASAYEGVTEIQAGCYLLMDTLYTNRGADFRRTLTILATVVSVPEPNRAVIDCGMKGLSAERGLSAVKDLDGIELKALHAEHGLLEISNADSRLDPGRRIELWVQYQDATVNLHRQMYGMRNGEVEEVFKIEC